MTTEKAVFTEIANNSSWGSKESISGPGSALSSTAKLRAELPVILSQLRIKKLIDAPCGDRNWIKHLEYEFDLYIGVDIVETLVERARAEDTRPGYFFQAGNIATDILPKADAIFCRDCLVHLPFRMIWDSILRFKIAGFDYLITTTFPGHKENWDGRAGGWRPLNLQAAPFCFPKPLHLLGERHPNPADPFNDKSLAVWALSDLPEAAPA